MKLSAWARKNGVSYQTAWNWFSAGQLPVPARQTATGTILVEEPTSVVGKAALYARVSSHDQKSDLNRQVARLSAFAAASGLTVASVVTEVDAGLNGARPKLTRLLRDPAISALVVEHRDRLTTFGFEYLQAALLATGRQLVVVDEKELHDDLVRDMVEVLTSFCARLYGRRSAKHRAAAAVAAAGSA
jgi:putative resolvase